MTRERRISLGALFFAAIVVFRGRSFFTPFADPTAGLYLHIAQAWLHGHVPYTTTWDYRPPGLLALYAGALAVLGASLARDALAVISLAATALAVGLIAARIDARASRNIGWWAAAFFVMLSPVNDGLAGVAELQISAFVAWAIYLALASRASLRGIALCGLLAGLALQCKLTAVPLVAIPLALVVLRSGLGLRAAAVFGAGLGAPALASIALYARAHQLPALWNANVEGTLRRMSSGFGGDEFARNRGNFARQLVALAPQIEFAAAGLSATVNRSRLASAGWFVAGVFSIVAAGEFYERQFVLLSAPAAVLGAIGFTRIASSVQEKRLRNGFVIASLLLTFVLHDYFETNQSIAFFIHRVVLGQNDWHADQSQEVLTTLRCTPRGPGRLFLVGQNPYLYDLLNDPAPTVYAYTDHLFDPRLSAMAGIDGAAELARVLRGNPQFIVVSSLDDFRFSPKIVAELRAKLATDYDLRYRSRRAFFYAYGRADARMLRSLCETRELPRPFEHARGPDLQLRR